MLTSSLSFKRSLPGRETGRVFRLKLWCFSRKGRSAPPLRKLPLFYNKSWNSADQFSLFRAKCADTFASSFFNSGFSG